MLLRHWCSAGLLLLAMQTAVTHAATPQEDFAAQRAAIEQRIKLAEYQRDVQEVECAKQFIVNSCIKEAKSAFFAKQIKLAEEMAALNKREREFEAAARARERSENQQEQAARIAATPTPAQPPKLQRSAQDAAESKAAFDAKQADAKKRVEEQQAKINKPAPPAKPPAVPRSADAAAMAAADANAQQKQKEIAARKAEIDKKKSQTTGKPLPATPLNPVSAASAAVNAASSPSAAGAASLPRASNTPNTGK